MAFSETPLVTILVATPTTAFGELIRHSLEESGGYRVQVAASLKELLISLGTTQFAFAVIDSDMPESSPRELAAEVLQRSTGTRLVLIPPNNDPDHPAVAGIQCIAYLRKPFYLPDLIDLFGELSTSHLQENAPPNPALGWITPPIFDRLLSTTSARGGAIVNRQGEIVLGGVLAESTGDSPKSLFARFWQREELSDLVRFTRLETPEGICDCLIYTTALDPQADVTASLVYPTHTPLSKIRIQAAPLLQALRELSHQTNPLSGHLSHESAQDDKTQTPEKSHGEIIGSDLDADHEVSSDVTAEDSAWGEEPVLEKINLTELLGSIPSPDPNNKNGNFQLPTAQHHWKGDPGWVNFTDLQESGANNQHKELLKGWEEICDPPQELRKDGNEAGYQNHALPVGWEETGIPEDKAPLPGDAEVEKDLEPLPTLPQDDPPLRWEQEILADPGGETPRIPTIAEIDGDTLPAGSPVSLTESETTLTVDVKNDKGIGTALTTSGDDDDEAETAGETGNVLISLTSLDQMEPATAGISLLNYTCALVPRLPQHHLTGELSEKLSQWIQQLCLAFGWRLEGIALRPDYIQWTVQVAPNISPGNVVKIVRQRSSQWIFTHFSKLGDENPSGDFWATGYLLVSGAHPPSSGLLRDFVQQTRRRQGVLPASTEKKHP
jgi:CheY-like chemotaxis protein